MLNSAQQNIKKKKPTLRMKIYTNADKLIKDNGGLVPKDFEERLKITQTKILLS
jgi:hypothetical protein